MIYRKETQLPDKILFSNNDRKYHGLPLHRKIGKKKRYFTRKECTETIRAFLDYVNK